MGHKLAVNVMLTHPDSGENVLFTPDSGDLPDWAVKEITNPDVWAGTQAAAAAKNDGGGSGEFDLSSSIADLLGYVGDDQAKAQAVLEAEQATDTPRKGLVEGLQKVANPGTGGFDVAGSNMKEVLAYVGEDPAKAQAALDAEQAAETPRTSLVEKLTKLASQ